MRNNTRFKVGALGALIITVPVLAGPPAKHAIAVPPQCKALRADYDRMGKEKAWNFATHEPDTEVLEQTHMTLELMRDNKCPMPTAEPEFKPWISAAFKCRLANLKAQGDGNLDATIEPCDRSKWQPDSVWGK